MTTVLTVNELLDIVNQLKAQFEAIDKTGDYNFNVPDGNIIKGFETLDTAKSFPSIYIAYIEANHEQENQLEWYVAVNIEVFAYAKSSEDTLDEGLKLASDMTRAIYEDESLGGRVYELALNFSVTAFESTAIVYLNLAMKYSYQQI